MNDTVTTSISTELISYFGNEAINLHSVEGVEDVHLLKVFIYRPSLMQCSGSKVKKFLPILEAAAGGKLDSKWYHRRSLESVDFKSCGFLTDVDVNALCVLHSRVNFSLVDAWWYLLMLFFRIYICLIQLAEVKCEVFRRG